MWVATAPWPLSGETHTVMGAQRCLGSPRGSARSVGVLSVNAGHKLWKRDFTGAAGIFTVVLDKKYSNESFGRSK